MGLSSISFRWAYFLYRGVLETVDMTLKMGISLYFIREFIAHSQDFAEA